tara:strand:+ start:237 stop:455 length:219 start_codon:yes stop_codon:yes gene_type:complete
MKRHPIGTGDGLSSQVAGADSDRVISAFARQKFKVHFPWCAGHSGLTSQFRGGGCGEAQVGGHVLLRKRDSS